MDILAKGKTGAGTPFEGVFELEEIQGLTCHPECKLDVFIPLKVKGYSYKVKKENARRLAIDVQAILPEMTLSQGDAAIVADFIRTIGARFHLLPEFRGNGIL